MKGITWNEFEEQAKALCEASRSRNLWRWRASPFAQSGYHGFIFLADWEVARPSLSEVEPLEVDEHDDADAEGVEALEDDVAADKPLANDSHLYQLHIVYSPNYQVPVLYFNGVDRALDSSTAEIVPNPPAYSVGRMKDLHFERPEDFSLEKARKPVHEEFDAPYSPCTPQPQSDIGYDSEEDSEAGYETGARIGPKYQADLTDLYGSELAADDAELLWDPDTMSDDSLDLLLAQCRVGDSTFRQMTAPRSITSSAATTRPTSPAASSTSYSRPSSPKPSEVLDTSDKFLDLWSMLQLVNACGYKSDVVLETMKIQGLFGWSSLKTAFTPWAEEEKASFETAFGALLAPKRFDQVASHVGTRTTGECIEFYYGWKHSERCKAWKSELMAERLSSSCADDPVPLSRMLPSSATRKRKRDLDVPALDSSERVYLEALDYLHKTSESPELLLNIIIDTPNFLAQDGVAGLHHDSSALPLDDSTSPLSGSATIAASTCDAPDAIASHPSAGHFEEHSAIAGADTLVNVIPRLSAAAASPKRPKLAEIEEHTILHSSLPLHDSEIPLSASTSTLAGAHFDFSSNATVDPHNMFFSPPEPPMDLFMHF